MENASKALIMAASVLLGLMIISVGVALFNSFSDFSKTTLDKVEETKIAEWNNNFLKYYGTISTYNQDTKQDIIGPIKVTAHDIVTIANLAKQNNEKYELNENNSGNKNTYYVQVVVKKVKIDDKEKTFLNFETLPDSDKNKILQENSVIITSDDNGDKKAETKYYKCSKEPLVSDVTKRVYKIEFEPY